MIIILWIKSLIEILTIKREIKLFNKFIEQENKKHSELMIKLKEKGLVS